MMRREWALVLVLAAVNHLHSQEVVFVNLERLASHHPAWQLADSINRRPKPTVLSWSPPTLSLTDVPLSAPTLQAFQLADWLEGQKRSWASELEALQKRQQQIWVWQMHLLLPPLPAIDPVARWKFVVQQREKQASERVRLNLRLHFADMLSPEERAALEQRKRELDAELEPPPTIPQPIVIPIQPTERLDLTPPSPLTDPQKILDLVAPPVSPPQQISTVQVPDIGDFGSRSLTSVSASILRSIAFEAARNFATTYARRKGWKVAFSFQPNLPDVTGEVEKAWRQWLTSLKPRE